MSYCKAATIYFPSWDRAKTLSIVPLLVMISGCGSSTPTESKSSPAAATGAGSTTSPSGAPKVIPGTPLSGSGNTLTSAVVFHDDAGQTNISEVFMLVNDPGHGVDGTGGCVVWCQRLTGDVYLLDDAGKGWLGPHKLGSQNVLVNHQCLLSLGNTNVAESNGDLQWVVSLGFAKPFAGSKNVYAKAVNQQKLESNFALLGSWTVK
jgi:hypothetical protein